MESTDILLEQIDSLSRGGRFKILKQQLSHALSRLGLSPGEKAELLGRVPEGDERLIRRLEKVRQGPKIQAPDLHAYAFDFLLIVDSLWLAEFLYQNSFHFKYKGVVLPILSEDNESHFLEAVREHNIPVYVFHKCTHQSIHGFREDVRRRYFQGDESILIIDCGIWPVDSLRFFRKLKPRFRRGGGASRAGLSDKSSALNQDLFRSESLLLRSGLELHWLDMKPANLYQMIGNGIRDNLDLHFENRIG